MNWKSSDEAKRRRLRKQAERKKATIPRRWEHIASEDTSSWRERAEIAAKFIEPGEAVADIGSGAMHLKAFLPQGCRYIPMDLAQPKNGEPVILIELNQGSLPPTGADVAVALGLMEHLHDVAKFVSEVGAQYRHFITSYAVSEWRKPRQPEPGWFNNFSSRKMRMLFRRYGFAPVGRARWKDQRIWNFRKVSDS